MAPGMAADSRRKNRSAAERELAKLRAELDELRGNEPREALRRSEASLRNAQRIAHLGSFDWNLETGVLEWSDENYRIFGMQPGTPIDPQRFLACVHPEDRPHLEQTVANAFQLREPFQLDYRILVKGGDVRFLSGQGEVEFNEEERPIRLSGTAQDRTEHRQIEATLSDYREHLEQLVEERTAELLISRQRLQQADRLASLGTLAAGLAHQINNPIAVILLAAQYGRARSEDSDSEGVIDKVLSDITTEAERCSKIVDSVLQLARSEAPEQWREDLNTSVQRACLLLSAYAGERHATFELDLQSSSLHVIMNPMDMEQVLVNLMRNAVESKAVGAAIRVTAKRASHDDGDQALITITDDGRGLTDDEKKRVFDPFYTTRLADGGSGLGLTLAHEIVRRHRGKLSVESTPGKGTTFEIELPCAE